MPQTVKQYAFFNVPLNSSQDVPPEDAWLFRDPFKIFDLHTPEATILKYYGQLRAGKSIRHVGVNRIPVKIVLKYRMVSFSEFVKVPGSDVPAPMTEKETEEAAT